MSSSHLHSDSGSSQIGAIFNAALKEYAHKTGTDLTTHPLTATLQACHSPEAILDTLRDQAHAFEQYRNGDWKVRLMRPLKSTIDILLGLSNGVFGEGIGLTFPPAKAIFAGVGLLLAAAKGVSSSYDALVDLFEYFEHYLCRLNIFTEVPFAVGEILVKIMVELIGVLALATQQIKQGRFRKFAKKFLGDNDIEAVLQRLDRLTMEESRMTAAQTMQVVHSLFNNMKTVMDDGKASTDNMQMALVTMQEIVEGLNKIKRGQLQEKVHKWLAPPDSSINHNNARETHHSETATWFIQSAVYNEWKTTGSVLWIHGKPGSGKSVLCSSIIKDVQGICTTGLASAAYHYFDFKDVGKQDRRGLLSSLLIQLCTRSHRGYDILSNLHAAHDNGLRQPSDTDLIRCLKDVLALPGQGKVYIIADALDECPNSSGFPKTAREKVLDLLEELVDLNLPDLRICVTSRPEIDIKNVVEPLTTRQMSLHDESGQREDILDYIRAVVLTDRKMRRWRLEDKQLVSDTLSAKADGMFRWVVCQLDMLRQCFPASLREALEELPATLDETYERVLSNIEKGKRRFAHRLFECLAVSVRPLRVEELAEVLAMRFGSPNVPDYHVNWRIENPYEAVLSACSSLIDITNVDGLRIVQFSHFSVKEFLTSDRITEAETNVSQYHIDSMSAHTILAQASLSILFHLGDRVDKKTIEDLPLAVYAAQHWVDHCQFEGVFSRIQDSVTRLFDVDNPSFVTWTWIYDIDYPLKTHMFTSYPTRPESTPLYYAILCGFRGVVEHLIATRPEDINKVGGYHTTALRAALAKEDFEIASLLIENGADVEILDRFGSRALHLASRYGRRDIVVFLLEHHADVNADTEDSQGDTPLLISSLVGEVNIARILLQHGAAVDACNNGRWTPLFAASRYGHLEIARLLIRSGAAVDHRENDDWAPLFVASRYGHLDVVRLLIQSGAAVDSRQIDGWTPLYAASRYGHLDVVRLLIQSGAAVDHRENHGLTPLFEASCDGHLDVVRLLLQSGAAIDARQNDGRTPLHVASRTHHIDIIQELLHQNASVNAQAADLSTPLHIASAEGHLSIVELLIQSSAEIDKKTMADETPLILVSGVGHLEIARLLLQNGSNPHAQDNSGWTPLHKAAHHGHLDIVKLLFESGVDLHARNGDDRTPLDIASENRKWEVASFLAACIGVNWDEIDPASENSLPDVVPSLPVNDVDIQTTSLHTASEEGNVDAVQWLLDHGANVNERNEDHESPLCVASSKGKLEVAKVLIKSGADADSRSKYGWTPLHNALQYGHLDIARLLIDHDANVNSKEQNGWSPLHLASANGFVELVQLLLERGADIETRNIEGRTASDEALRFGQSMIPPLLSQRALR